MNHGKYATYGKGCRCDDCRTANRIYNRDWQRRNRAKVSASNMRWAKNNPDNVHAIETRYKKTHREQIKAYRKRKRYEDPEKARENFQRWARENPGKAKAHNRKGSLTRKARKRGAFVESVDPAIVYDRDKGFCGICGDAVVGDFHIDHIVPISKGGLHCYDNVQLAHPFCNMQKSDKC